MNISEPRCYNIGVIGCGNIDCKPTMIQSITILPPSVVSTVHGSESNPKAATVSSLLFIIMKCFSLPAPLWCNDLPSLRVESLHVFEAENSTFYDVSHIIISLLSQRRHQLTLQNPPDITPLLYFQHFTLEHNQYNQNILCSYCWSFWVVEVQICTLTYHFKQHNLTPNLPNVAAWLVTLCFRA